MLSSLDANEKKRRKGLADDSGAVYPTAFLTSTLLTPYIFFSSSASLSPTVARFYSLAAVRKVVNEPLDSGSSLVLCFALLAWNNCGVRTTPLCLMNLGE